MNAPEEAFVVDRLSRVQDIAYLAAVTEENDPNNQLGKAGGYTAWLVIAEECGGIPFDAPVGQKRNATGFCF